MLVDNVTLQIKAGKGGDGSASFLRNGQTDKGGPDGGNGGNGGNIYFQGSNNVNDLKEFRFKKKITAEDGIPGKKQKLFGKNAPHTTIYVPLGTHIKELDSGRTYEIKNSNTPILLAKGGIGGRGNTEFKSATNQSPQFAEEGTPGEEKALFLELKIIAEIGLIGLPNAGKSSLLTVLTNAKPKIGNFPFTTLEPNIGMKGSHALADIPGLIEGASTGKGLGITFLRHIEKTKALVHCIDSTEEHPTKAYETVRNEFEKYNATLLKKEEIIVLTKSDLVDEKTLEKTKKLFEKKGKQVITCSIYDQESLDNLEKTLEQLL